MAENFKNPRPPQVLNQIELERRRNAWLRNRAQDKEEVKKDMRLDEYQPKIPGAAVATGFILLGVADMIELTIFMFALDDFLLSDMITFPITQLYLRYKNARGTYSLVTQTVELIPYVGFMPLKSFGWGMVVWVDRHPEGRLAKAAQLVSKVIPKIPMQPKSAPVPR